MALPKVNVNVNEQTLITANNTIPFVPAVLLKTKSGPIGTVETITSEAQFKAIFGESDYTTPSAYALQTYLRSYSYVLVTRLANEEAAKKGKGVMTFTPDDGEAVNLITIDTEYKTDLFNGKEVKLVYDGTNNKLWLDVSAITGKNTISIKEDFTADTAKATELEAALTKLVASINAANLGIVLTNNFTNKTTSDDTPSVEAYTNGFSAYISEGDSGNTTDIDVAKVKAMIDMYDLPEKNIDVMVIPEYTSYEVVNYATALANKNNFLVITSPKANSVQAELAAVANYEKDAKGSLAIYFPNVYYNNFVNANGEPQEIPACMAVLHTYARTDIQNKWAAPAGVTRGNLTLVSGLSVLLSKDDLAALYDNTIPVNGINEISGKGFIVWGNKTTNSTSTFFDRINVARLVKYVTKRAYNISWDYLFEPITQYVFTDWSASIESLLDGIKTEYGIEDYQVIMDSTINTEATIAANQLNGIIRIKPQEVAEFINIDLTITDTITVSVAE